MPVLWQKTQFMFQTAWPARPIVVVRFEEDAVDVQPACFADVPEQRQPAIDGPFRTVDAFEVLLIAPRADTAALPPLRAAPRRPTPASRRRIAHRVHTASLSPRTASPPGRRSARARSRRREAGSSTRDRCGASSRTGRDGTRGRRWRPRSPGRARITVVPLPRDGRRARERAPRPQRRAQRRRRRSRAARRAGACAEGSKERPPAGHRSTTMPRASFATSAGGASSASRAPWSRRARSSASGPCRLRARGSS